MVLLMAMGDGDGDGDDAHDYYDGDNGDGDGDGDDDDDDDDDDGDECWMKLGECLTLPTSIKWYIACCCFHFLKSSRNQIEIYLLDIFCGLKYVLNPKNSIRLLFVTLPETNIEPANWCLEDDSLFF